MLLDGRRTAGGSIQPLMANASPYKRHGDDAMQRRRANYMARVTPLILSVTVIFVLYVFLFIDSSV